MTDPTPGTQSVGALLTVAEVAERVRLSQTAVRRAIRDGQLQATQLRGQLRVTEQAVDEWLTVSTVQPAQARLRPVARPHRPAPTVPAPAVSFRGRRRKDAA